MMRFKVPVWWVLLIACVFAFDCAVRKHKTAERNIMPRVDAHGEGISGVQKEILQEHAADQGNVIAEVVVHGDGTLGAPRAQIRRNHATEEADKMVEVDAQGHFSDAKAIPGVPKKICLVTTEFVEGNNPMCCGFASYLLTTLQCIKQCEDDGLMPFVHWDHRVKMVCPQNAHGSNCWTNFFEPLVEVDDLQGRSAMCIAQENIRDPSLQQWITSGRHVLDLVMDQRLRTDLGRVFNKYVALKRQVSSYVNTFAAKYFEGRHVLGIHVRGTDYSNEYGESLIPPSDWIEAAKHIYLRMPIPKSIFVASDNQYIIGAFEREPFFNGVVLFSNATRTTDYDDTGGWYNCFLHGDDTDDCKQNVAEGIVHDIWLLSRCDELLFWEGAVSRLALLLNPSMNATSIRSLRQSEAPRLMQRSRSLTNYSPDCNAPRNLYSLTE